MVQAYPLSWPSGYSRTETPQDSKFKVPVTKSLKALHSNIELLSGDKKPVISSNVPLRKKDGGMYTDVAKDELQDSGVAVYFMFNGEQKVIACDKWKTPEDNLRAIVLTLESLRGLDRWGASDILAKTFSELKALPEQSSFNQQSIWEVLGLSTKPAAIEIVHASFKILSKKLHPDITGGSAEAFNKLTEAYKEALKQY